MNTLPNLDPKIDGNLFSKIEIHHIGWFTIHVRFTKKPPKKVLLKIHYSWDQKVYESHQWVRCTSHGFTQVLNLYRPPIGITLEEAPTVLDAHLNPTTKLELAIRSFMNRIQYVLERPTRIPGFIGTLLSFLKPSGLSDLKFHLKSWAYETSHGLDHDYHYWTKTYDTLHDSTLEILTKQTQQLTLQPCISILALAPDPHLASALKNQLYPHWVIAKDPAHITNDYTLTIGPNTILRPHALSNLILTLNQYPNAKLIYADEDHISSDGQRHNPIFKPSWDPEYLYSINYLNSIALWRTQCLQNAFKTQDAFKNSAQNSEILRSFSRTLDEQHIHHIPKILTHHSSPVLQKSFSSPNTPSKQTIETYYPLPASLPLVSIIICTKDKLKLLRGIVDGILQHTSYSPLELIILDNRSSEQETLDYLANLQAKKLARVIRYDAPFNFSAMNNVGAEQASGEILAFLNNDLLVITPDWLQSLVRHAHRPTVGAVGAKLYYPNNTLQHAGVILGIGGVAGHSFKGQPGQFKDVSHRPQAIQRVSAVTGACLVVKKSDFFSVGGFDGQNLAVAFNDIDLCLKLQKKGLHNIYTPFAELYHLESASRGSDMTPENLARFQGEITAMEKRWSTLLQDDPYYNENLTLLSEDFSFSFPPRGAAAQLGGQGS